jgi:phage N-6-adenine-methyltransferase
MNTEVMFSSKSCEHGTPDDFYEKLDAQYHFELDPCSTHENAKCKRHFTVEENGLALPWYGMVFMNPPYGRQIVKWMSKAYYESRSGNAPVVVCLVPARTDTAWWHDYVEAPKERGEATVKFIRGRLKFKGNDHPAPFPSALVVYGG